MSEPRTKPKTEKQPALLTVSVERRISKILILCYNGCITQVCLAVIFSPSIKFNAVSRYRLQCRQVLDLPGNVRHQEVHRRRIDLRRGQRHRLLVLRIDTPFFFTRLFFRQSTRAKHTNDDGLIRKQQQERKDWREETRGSQGERKGKREGE